MRSSLCGVVSVIALVSAASTAAADTPQTRSEIEAFMRSARVASVRESSKGVTRPLRLTLSDGTFTHDASFQAIEERKARMEGANGLTEFNFVDSWRYNLAAYRLADRLGLADMMPITIEYRYRNKIGSLTWWMDSLMDEGERLAKKLQPPDPALWNEDMLRMRVFMELVHDTDRNLGNVLVSPAWRVIMLDFTRAFRLWPTIRPNELPRIDRALLAELETLTGPELAVSTKDYLSRSEVEAVMKRRDLIVEHFRARVKQLGEARVLYLKAEGRRQKATGQIPPDCVRPHLSLASARLRRMKSVVLGLAFVLASGSPAFATWSVIALDAATGQAIIASATCVRQGGFPQRQPNGSRDLMDVQAVIVPAWASRHARPAWTTRARIRCSSTTS